VVAGERGPRCPYCAIMLRLPAPTNERQSLERERAELPGQIVAYESELDATSPEHTARRERLVWQLRRAQKRLAEVEARLANGRLPHPYQHLV
jgi:hypothetical protein